MTRKQLKDLDAELERRGYRKWTTCLIGQENYAWIKPFGIHEDKYGDDTSDYQIFFRIFDWHGIEIIDAPEQSKVWITVTMAPSELDNSLDCDYSLQLDVPDIDMCEKMMAEFFETAKKYMPNRHRES